MRQDVKDAIIAFNKELDGFEVASNKVNKRRIELGVSPLNKKAKESIKDATQSLDEHIKLYTGFLLKAQSTAKEITKREKAQEALGGKTKQNPSGFTQDDIRILQDTIDRAQKVKLQMIEATLPAPKFSITVKKPTKEPKAPPPLPKKEAADTLPDTRPKPVGFLANGMLRDAALEKLGWTKVGKEAQFKSEPASYKNTYHNLDVYENKITGRPPDEITLDGMVKAFEASNTDKDLEIEIALTTNNPEDLAKLRDKLHEAGYTSTRCVASTVDGAPEIKPEILNELNATRPSAAPTPK